MNMKSLFAFGFVGMLMVSAFAADEQERELFGKWRIGVGAALNFGVDANIGTRNLPSPSGYVVPFGSTKQDAWNRANAHLYDGNGYIASDNLNNGYATENWKLPAANRGTDGSFDLGNAYQEVLTTDLGNRYFDNSDSEMQYGLSLEFSRELWIHDEQEEHRWGVDFAAAFSYFFRRDLYRASGTMTRTDTVRDGRISTLVDDPDAMWMYDNNKPDGTPWDSPVNGMYGHGNFVTDRFSPALGWDCIGDPTDVGGMTRPVASSYHYNASGDYRELEMLFMLRPWYEIKDWWRVYGEIGLGVSWGKFETSMSTTTGYFCDETFAQWDCYGVVGLGTVVRVYDNLDLAVDVLGRFLRDDLEVDGRHLKGTIDRSNWGVRIMLGYSF